MHALGASTWSVEELQDITS